MPSSPPLLPGADPSCPFCVIAAAYPPAAPTATFNLGPPTPATTTATHPPSHSAANHPLAPEKTSPPSFVLLSTPDVIAFLDIAPLTRGHVLIATRRHRVKTVDLSTAEGAELGRVLPLIARAVLRAVFPDLDPSEADYNLVQNNGPLAAQVIPHIHFHLVPRPGRGLGSYGSTPSFAQQSWLSFGRGGRTELDDDDALVLVEQIREEARREVERIKLDEDVDLEAWWAMRQGLGLDRGEAKAVKREREKL